MAYLKLGGITVAVSVEGSSLDFAGTGGEEARSPAGSLMGGPVSLKREWSLTTTPVPASEVDAWVGLIEGRGHSWPFNLDFYSARGRGLSAGSPTLVTVGEKWGDGHLRVGAGAFVSWTVQSTSAWTTLHWRYESGAWKHYVCRSDSARWVNGVRNDASSGGIDIFEGVLSITGASGLTDYDDVVALPYAVPDSWPPLLYAQHNTAAWSELPRVAAAGSFCSSELSVRGKVTDSRVMRCAPAGALTTAYALSFTLHEV
jgi:hypothetical protein